MQRIPDVVYRLANSGPEEAAAWVPYLDALGASDLAIAVFDAAAEHGADAPPALDALSAELRARGMGLMADWTADRIAASLDHPGFRSAVERGDGSPWARFLDFDWDRPASGGKVVLPVLPVPYGEALSRGQIRVELAHDGFVARTFGLDLPLCLESWRTLVSRRRMALEAVLGAGHPALLELREFIGGTMSRAADRVQLAAHLRRVIEEHPHARILVDDGLSAVNTPGPHGTALLHRVLEQQAWRLAWCEDAEARVHHRAPGGARWIGTRPESQAAIHALHGALVETLRDGRIQGVRLHGVDGLPQPAAYLRLLCEEATGADGSRPFVALAGALGGMEDISGSDGRDFLHAVTRLQLDAAGLDAISSAYRGVVGPMHARAAADYARREVLRDAHAHGLARLVERVAEAAAGDPLGRDLPRPALEEALVALIAALPFPRTCLAGAGAGEVDVEGLRGAAERAVQAGADPRALAFLSDLMHTPAPDWATDADKAQRRRIVERWEQLCAAAAQDAEARVLVRDQRLLALNEDGGDPTCTGPDLGIAAFQRFCAARAASTPHALNATVTSRPRLGEDARARLTVLTELGAGYLAISRRWARRSRPLKTLHQRRLLPDARTEWWIQQLVLAGWPLHGESLEAFAAQVQDHVLGTLEAAGGAPVQEAERQAVTRYVHELLVGADGAPVRADLKDLRARTAFFGFLNSLSQVLAKVTAPGVPEIAAGRELWDLRIGAERPDPDALERSRATIAELERVELAGSMAEAVPEWIRAWKDGRIKAWVTRRVVKARRELPALFRDGEYLPLAVEGEFAQHVCAYARRNGEQWAVIAFGCGLTSLTRPGRLPAGRVWKDTAVLLPDGAPRSYLETLSGRGVAGTDRICCADLFQLLPQALCLPT